jgi:hypothetical protein
MKPDDSKTRVLRGHGDKSRFRERAIVALLSASSVERAAKTAGMSRATLLRWMRDEGFKAELTAARRALVADAISRLQTMLTDATTTLQALLACRAPTVRLGAARALVEFAFRAKDAEDFESRLIALEQHVTREAEQ